MVKAIVFFAAGVLFGLLAVGALRNLWADYQDSPAWVYVLYGSVAGLGGLLCLALAARSLRGR